MSHDLIAKAAITIDAARNEVWTALTDPDTIEKYMFGAHVSSDWKVGSPIVWKGEMKGKPYEDKGVIREYEPSTKLAYSHYSPMSGEPDKPENYHLVTITLDDASGKTHLQLTQDHNASEDAKIKNQENWTAMLKSLKKVVES